LEFIDQIQLVSQPLLVFALLNNQAILAQLAIFTIFFHSIKLLFFLSYLKASFLVTAPQFQRKLSFTLLPLPQLTRLFFTLRDASILPPAVTTRALRPAFFLR